MASDTGPATPEGRGRVRSALRWWRGSLTARVVTTTVVLGAVVVLALGSVLYQQVANGLVAQAVDSAQRDASQQVLAVQDGFDSTDRRDDTGLRQSARAQIQAIAGPSPAPEGGRRVILLAAESNDRGRVVEAMAVGVGADSIPEGLRSAIDADPEYQQVSVTRTSLDGGDEVTVVAVGARVNLLRAGPYDLVLFYPLDREEETLALVRQLFGVGGFVLLLLVVGLAVIAGRMVTRPVGEVARVSRDLAAGDLDERVPVRGTDEVAQLASSFNTMADSLQHQIRELRSLSQLQQRFVSDVSHELRTPLTTMRMAGAVLHASRDDFPAPVARSAELLDQELDRFEELLTELLEISRYDSGSAVLERHPEDIVPVVRSAMEGTLALAATHGSALVLHAPALPVEVDMDGRRIARVLRNLLTNALEHGEGRPVVVTVASTTQAVAIAVRDQGIGLSPEDAARVFDRFWRADPARNRTAGGTGLGLAIAVEDARVHGGWLQVGSAEGHGACFRLTLPRSSRFVIADRPPRVPEQIDPEASAPAESAGLVTTVVHPGPGATAPGSDAAVPSVVLALAPRERDDAGPTEPASGLEEVPR